MAIRQLITEMTFYHYRVEIIYHSLDNGAHGFMYAIYEGDGIVGASNLIFKTALKAGHGALSALEEMHNEKD